MSDLAALLPPVITGYTLERPIGRGGMGEVYLAVDATGTRWAIKFLDVRSAEAAELHLRFEREIRLARELRHPHIVSMKQAGTAGGVPYFVMEYMEGGNLRDRLEAGRPMTRKRVRAIVQQVSAALAYLAEHGVVHRDLKPENILFDSEGNVKLGDFGIAAPQSEIGNVTSTGQVVGTFDYMSPEQRSRLPVDSRCDQFSLAVIVYEMLTGRIPLGHFKPVTNWNPAVHASVNGVLQRALSEEPDDRYPNVTEFARDLDRALARRPLPRWWVRVAAAGAILTALVAIAIVLATHSHSSDSLPSDRPDSEVAAEAKAAGGEEREEPPPGESFLYYLSLGERHLADGRDKDAEACFNEAIRLNPKDGRAYLKRAFIYKKHQLFQKALDDLHKTLELIPEQVDALTGMGAIYVQLKDYAKAIPPLDRALQLQPNRAEALAWRGWAWHKLRDDAKAMADLNAAINTGYDNGTACQYRAILHRLRRNYQAALQDLNMAAERMPDNPYIHGTLANFLALCPDVKLRNPQLALEHAKRACELTNWGDWKMLKYYAQASAAAGQLDQAVEYCHRATRIAPPLERSQLDRLRVLYERRRDAVKNKS